MNKKTTEEKKPKQKAEKPIEILEPISAPRLVSYKMTATIRTGEYQNIIPEIMVEGGTIEDARDILCSEINLLRKAYDPSFRPVQVTPKVNPEPRGDVKPAPEAVKPAKVDPKPVEEVKAPQEPVKAQKEVSVAFDKAEKALTSCQTEKALDLIVEQVMKSAKLNDKEKQVLIDMANTKAEIFNGNGK